jgi:hypothetical protein
VKIVVCFVSTYVPFLAASPKRARGLIFVVVEREKKREDGNRYEYKKTRSLKYPGILPVTYWPSNILDMTNYITF